MKAIVLIILAGMMMAAGCSRREPANVNGTGGAKDERLEGDEVLIQVNGKELSRAEAERQMRMRLGPPPADLDAEQIAQIENRVLSRVVDEFVKRELLLHEADRLGIQATDEDVERGMQRILKQTPPGRTPQGILSEGPAGTDALRNEVITGIRIEKLLAARMPPIPEPTESEIEAFREEHREKLMLPERVRARHILVRSEQGEPGETPDEKRALAERYRRQLLDGADFAGLATEVSQCPSAANGGDLGIFPRGKMHPAFEEAAFRQAVGEIGDIVETPFGFHIIRVEQHLDAGLAQEDAIRNAIKQRKHALALADYVRDLQRSADIRHSPSVRPPAPPSETP